jgi:hypothetical protein
MNVLGGNQRTAKMCSIYSLKRDKPIYSQYALKLKSRNESMRNTIADTEMGRQRPSFEFIAINRVYISCMQHVSPFNVPSKRYFVIHHRHSSA